MISQLGIDIAQHLRGLVLKPGDVAIDIERRIVPHFAQFGNLAIERRDLFFEVQKGYHRGALGRWRLKVNAGRTVGHPR